MDLMYSLQKNKQFASGITHIQVFRSEAIAQLYSNLLFALYSQRFPGFLVHTLCQVKICVCTNIDFQGRKSECPDWKGDYVYFILSLIRKSAHGCKIFVL